MASPLTPLSPATPRNRKRKRDLDWDVIVSRIPEDKLPDENLKNTLSTNIPFVFFSTIPSQFLQKGCLNLVLGEGSELADIIMNIIDVSIIDVSILIPT